MLVEPMYSLAHSMQVSKGVYALLLGSGVSRSAGIMTGWEVTLDLVRRTAGEDVGQDPQDWYVKKHGKEPDYSELLQAAAVTADERRRLIQHYFERSSADTGPDKLPTKAHRAIANMVSRGYVRVILTTNFDRLMERALTDAGVAYKVVASGDDAAGMEPLVHQTCLVIKLHGDYMDARIKNTQSELAKYDRRMVNLLDQVLDEFGLIISGWSGEWDVALIDAVRRCKSRRYSTYWVSRGEPKPKAKDIISCRSAQVIQAADADAFFSQLDETVVHLKSLSVGHPLSEAVAVASVKQRMADPNGAIRLHDLFQENLLAAISTLEAELSTHGVPTEPDREKLRRKLELIDARLKGLRAMYFHAAMWCTEAQIPLILRPLELFLSKCANGSPRVWNGLEAYPGTSLLYAAYLGAISTENYKAFLAFMGLKYRAQRGLRSALDYLTADGVLQLDVTRTIFDADPRDASLSEHLYRVMRPMALRSFPDVEESFDRVEVLIALSYLHRRVGPVDAMYTTMGQFAFPRGRFVLKAAHGMADHPAERLLKESEQEGEQWPPLRDGLFDSGQAKFAVTREVFRKTLPKMHGWHRAG